MMKPKKIWVRVIPKDKDLEDVIKNSQLPVSLMIKILKATKNLYNFSSRVKGITVPGKKIKYSLMFNGLSKGSSVAEFEPTVSEQTMLNEELTSYSDPIVDTFSDYFELLNEKEESEAKKNLDLQLKRTKDRANLLIHAYDLWSRTEFEVEIITGEEKKTGKVISLPVKYRQRIKKWLSNEIKHLKSNIEGAITRIQLDGRQHFVFKTVEGKLIKGIISTENRNEIINLIETPLKIQGVIKSKGRSKMLEFGEIVEMEPLTTKTYHRLGDLVFVKPIVLDYTFDDDLFVLNCKELGISVWGTTQTELENNLSEEIEFLKEAYINSKDSELTTDALELKAKLIDHLGDKD
ncbi:MAG: hypothetical protein ACTSUE_15610 [Promethearchaeota archaeon]